MLVGVLGKGVKVGGVRNSLVVYDFINYLAPLIGLTDSLCDNNGLYSSISDNLLTLRSWFVNLFAKPLFL